jgi:SAM-dependent methyltransferase
LGIKSVLDIGCGAGAWLAAYRDLGVEDLVGVDGDYVDRSMLLVEPCIFKPCDITKPLALGRHFDLVQCLEVAEHIPRGSSNMLVDNIVRHGKQVLFSAAVPGQGGEEHINEQPYEYWRNLFASRGYRLYDFVRPRIRANEKVEPWYRYNIMFFAHDSVSNALPAEVRNARVFDNAPIDDYAPATYRLRKLLVRSLPMRLVSLLAVWKHDLFVRKLQRAKGGR